METVKRDLVAIANRYPVSKLVLYGSRARGDFSPRSDIDVAVYGSFSPQEELKLKGEIDEIPTLLNIDLVFCHRCTNKKLLENIEKEGVVLLNKLESKKENFKRAVLRLKESIQSYQTNHDDIVRDGMIQRFEFTIELAWKTIRAYLIDQGFTDLTSPKMVLKQAYSAQLIQNQESWLQMLQDRNQTSHMYNENTANEIASRIIESYLICFEQLLNVIG